MSVAGTAAAPDMRARMRGVREALMGAVSDGAHLGLIALAVGLWIWALVATDPGGVGAYGLLDVLPAQFYVAFAVLCAGFALAATRRRVSVPVLVLYALALLAFLHLTSAILFHLPRFAWTYKHIGPIELIATTGTIHPKVDIYNNWPGFFAQQAWLQNALHISPLVYSRWAQPAYATGAYAAVVFALRGFTTDPRRVYVAAFLFVIANWVGQDYFSPQAVGFIMSFVVLGLALRVRAAAVPTRLAPLARLRAALERRGNRFAGGPLHASPPAPLGLGPRAALAIGAVCWVALVTTHQLSPFIVLGWFVVLAVLGRGVPPWLVVVMAALQVPVLIHAWSWLSAHVHLFAPDLAASARPPGFNGSLALGGATMAKDARVAVIALMVALGIAGAVRRSFQGRWDPVLYALPVVPIILALVQRYGGEGPLRAYLFSLPFLALLAVDACSPKGLLRRRRLVVVALLLAASAPMTFFALELVNRTRPEDLATALWVERNVPAGAVRIYPADTAVTVRDVTARYAALEPSPLIRMAIDPRYLGHRWGSGTVAQLVRQLERSKRQAGFVIITPGQEEYLREYGQVPPGSVQSFTSALERDPRFQALFRDGPAVVFRWVRRAPAGG